MLYPVKNTPQEEAIAAHLSALVIATKINPRQLFVTLDAAAEELSDAADILDTLLQTNTLPGVDARAIEIQLQKIQAITDELLTLANNGGNPQ